MKRFLCTAAVVVALLGVAAPTASAGPTPEPPCILGYAWC